MRINLFEEVDDQIEWAVHEGLQLMASLRNRDQDITARKRSGTSWDIKRQPTKSTSKASLFEDGWKE